MSNKTKKIILIFAYLIMSIICFYSFILIIATLIGWASSFECHSPSEWAATITGGVLFIAGLVSGIYLISEVKLDD